MELQLGRIANIFSLIEKYAISCDVTSQQSSEYLGMDDNDIVSRMKQCFYGRVMEFHFVAWKNLLNLKELLHYLKIFMNMIIFFNTSSNCSLTDINSNSSFTLVGQ